MKRKLKSLLSVCLATVCMSSGLAITANASNTQDSEMDVLDILISAHTFLSSEDAGENLWPSSIKPSEIVPLYDKNGETIAYYLMLSKDKYAVINNNRQNPAAIEYGEGDNPLIREIIDNNANPHIIYNNPFSLYDLNNKASTTKMDMQSPVFYEYYPDLKESNTSLSNFHAQQRESIVSTYGDIATPYGDYGFIDWDNMPSGSYTADTIPLSGVSWVITSDFADIANDHCGATAVTNLALYFTSKGYSNLKKGNNRDTFIAVHDIVGDGPVMTIADKADTYFFDCGYTLNYESIGTYDSLKKAIRKDKPCGILLANGIVDWHWIIGVGYRDYFDESDYIRIMDGWNRTVNRFYRLNSGSLWISATSYSM